MKLRLDMGKYFILGAATAGAVLLSDQYTKWLMVETWLRIKPSGHSFFNWFSAAQKMLFTPAEYAQFKAIKVAPGLDFVMVWNRGVSFGMFDGGASGTAAFLTGLSLLISFFLIFWLAAVRRKVSAVFLGLIIGGALSNVLDRVRFGAVADFIDVYAGKYHWPAFNLADSCITLGAGILMLDAFMNKEISCENGVLKK